MVKALCPECNRNSVIVNVEGTITWKCPKEECSKEEFEDYEETL